MPQLSNHDVVACPTCHKPIRWTVTAAAKQLPVDAEPAEDGNTAAYYDGTGRLRSRGLTKERPALEHAEWRARPHFASCTARPARRSSGGGRARTGVRQAPWQGWQR